MLMKALNPSQMQQVNNFSNISKQEQAQQIADFCNQNNISKEKLQEIINMIKK